MRRQTRLEQQACHEDRAIVGILAVGAAVITSLLFIYVLFGVVIFK
jgi:hypothetical protein